MESSSILDVSLPRAVEPFLHPDDAVKIKVLEGARAAGKTTVASRLLESGAYDRMVSLADPDTLARAKSDVRLFVDDLGVRAVVDEAQLLADELSLALKDLVDRPGTHRRFLLTGSARIARTGLGGADPLAGRVERWTLDPLSATEIRGDTDSLAHMVDRLFGPVPDGVERDWPVRSAVEWTTTGGMPTWSVGVLSDARRQQMAAAWRDGVLTEHVLPGERRFDLAGATRVLDCLLRNPAAPLHVASVAQRLEIDSRTVSSYVDVLERRFLLRLLPNLALNPTRQTRRGAKIHAIDLSLARQALASADPAALTRPTTVGLLFETWVVNQALAACPFAEQQVSAFTWRVAKGDHEVDLVLVAGDGRRVGIEVKSSPSINPKDARGLKAFAASGDLHAGYVVYPGATIIRLGERVWALPVQAYLEGWHPTATRSTPRATERATMAPPVEKSPVPIAATVFVSYVHDDDDFLGGAITNFATDLAEAYNFTYGRPLKIFTDRLSLRWGENWRQRIADEIDKTSFLLANVTPRYLTSEACREEITRFDFAARAAGEPKLVLPIIWSPIENLGIVDDLDPVLQLVRSAQWEEGSDLSSLERGSAAYRQRLQQLSRRLHDTVTHLEQESLSTVIAVTAPAADDDVPDLFESLERLEPAAAEFSQVLEDVMVTLGAAFGRLGAGGTTNSTMVSARHELEPKIRRLDRSQEEFVTLWEGFTEPLRSLLRNSSLHSYADVVDWREQMIGLATGLEIPDKDQVLALLDAVGRTSRMLRPSVSAVGNAIRAIDAVRDSALAWADELASFVPSNLTVPSGLTGQSYDNAVTQLRNAGFTGTMTRKDLPSDSVAAGRVISVMPSSGSKVPVSQTFTTTMSTGKAVSVDPSS